MKAFILKALASLLIIFTPLFPVCITIGILIAIDFLIAVYKSYKLNQPITSRKMSNTISKAVLYQVAIISSFLAETYILTGIPLTKIISGFIALTELKSISESITELTGVNYWVKIQEFLKRKEN